MKENLEIDIQTQRVRRLKMPQMPQQAPEMLLEDTSSLPPLEAPAFDTRQPKVNVADLDTSRTKSVAPVMDTPVPKLDKLVVRNPRPVSLPDDVYTIKTAGKRGSLTRAERDHAYAQMVQECCRQICLSLFFHKQGPIRSLGFTSSI